MIRSLSRRIAGSVLLGAALAAPLLHPGSAAAAVGTRVEIRVEPADPPLPPLADFFLTAAPGRVNDVTVTQTVTAAGIEVFTIVDKGDVIDRGPGCVADPAAPGDPHRAKCSALNVLTAFVDLGDLDDTLSYSGSGLRARLQGGDGSDTLSATAGENLDFFGDAGDDRLGGGPGADTLIGGLGNDTMSGGGGIDTAVYSDHTAGVRVTLDGIANDGSGTETDNVTTENVTGGTGADRLTGGPGPNALRGFEGGDTLDGGPGADSLIGGNGVDTVNYTGRTTPVAVTLAGGADDGDVNGEGDNVVEVENANGGSAGDILVGNGLQNVLVGNAGDDTIVGNDGVDTLLGGLGFDFLDGGAPNTLPGDVCIVGGTGSDGGFTQNCP